MKNNLILFALVLAGFLTMATQCEKEKISKEKSLSELTITLDQTAWYCAETCRYNFTFTDGEVITRRYNAPIDTVPLWTCARTLASADWKQLVEALDKEAFGQVDETIGCPGCADEPIETITVQDASFEHAVRMNVGTEVSAIQPLLKELRTQAEAYKEQNNCE